MKNMKHLLKKNCLTKVCAYLCLYLVGIQPMMAQGSWQKKQAPIMTQWSQNIDTTKVMSEYPRPQMVRKSWMNLNGVWDLKKFASSDISAYKFDVNYDQRILVPFPVESALSGIMDTDYSNQEKSYIYRRYFSLLDEMKGKKILLNFGAVDWYCEVFVNGKSVGSHKGGYDPFSFDITNALKESGEQELQVQVYDPTQGGIPHGKQNLNPEGIWYTPSSGIWQTVWLEPVETSHINDFSIIPDIDNNRVKIAVNAPDASTSAKVKITIFDGNTQVTAATTMVGTEVAIPMANAKLWSPDSPFLYKLKFELEDAGNTVDEIGSYFGMRKISLAKINDYPRILLNNKIVFSWGTLDQGFWPDGIYTAPSYDALAYDLVKTKEFGMNMVRKHIKVEPARWYYDCDSLGLMVWQDMPCSDDPQTALMGDAAWIKSNFLRETTNIVNSLKNFPSIVVWIPFNEGWGQYRNTNSTSMEDGDDSHTKAGVSLIRKLDDTRLIDPASGWNSYECGDIIAKHLYSGPGVMDNTYKHRASVCGESGGWGYLVDGHTWGSKGNPYGWASDPTDLANKIIDMTDIAIGLKVSQGLCGVVYTQISDVEQELNGLMTYDRIDKMPANQIARVAEAIQKVSTTSFDTYFPTASQSDTINWKYKLNTDTDPQDWNKINYDDSGWAIGKSGFGNLDPPNTTTRTNWSSKTIYLRRNIHIGDLTSENLASLKLNIYHDEDFEIYINGILAASETGYITNYKLYSINSDALAAMKTNSDNLFAIKCKQTGGGQFIDMGLVLQKLDTTTVDNPGDDESTFTKISTPEQLDAIRNNLDKDGTHIVGNYILEQDIDMSGFDNFVPIGQVNGVNTPFDGFFSGNGYSIKNLKINRADVNNQGLFAYGENATFVDLALDNVNIVGKSDVGALMGKGVGDCIEKVSVTGYVEGVDHVGGLAGGTDSNGVTYIKNCYVNGTVKTRSTQVGGILGIARKVTIENSYAAGKVKAPTTNQGNNAGGLIGLLEDKGVYIRNCVALQDSVIGGSSSQFVPRGSGCTLADGARIYTRSDMVLADYATDDHGLGRATADQIFTPETFYEKSSYDMKMGWDFNNVWIMKDGSYPLLKLQESTGITKEVVDNSVPWIYSVQSHLIIKTQQPAIIYVYNIGGSLFKEKKSAGNYVSIEAPKGMYIVKCVFNNSSVSKKVMNK